MTDTVTFDQQHIWHPYSPTPVAMDPLPVESTSGVRITLEDGRTLIDGMSSWWAACHGHGHPALVAAAHRQIDTMSHVMFGGLTHRPAVDLAERLLRIAGEPLNRVFFCDSGSVSVEVAIKMALQYQRGNGHPERNRLITWRSGYHGDTFGPMSVCDPDGGMHSLWTGTLTEQIFAPAPPVRGSSEPERAEYLRRVGELIDESVAAMIIEPVVQGAGGMRFHDHELVAGVRELCDRHGILFIADEIATGFGRTGDLLATRAAGVHADILCLGKALTGGFMSLAAVLATDEVAAVIQKPEGGGALMHGPTFMANPLACAVGSASLDLVEGGYWRETVPRIEGELTRGLEPVRELPGVADVRVLGAIGVVEMERPVDMRAATDAAVAAGVWLRPFGRLIYTMPPFTATTQDVAAICTAMAAAAETGVSQ
ncbi:adenosylmethionine--8-amino-7-oxononanoate transaminase [Corynebacterium sp. CCM 8835]|uniref:Adenosylmethionine-8-amino-7-oxononanoate aminotransferase n=1 Tax=Corynebacterium antarcticum TaxID=2800405 RepID=A0ABS1FKH0_9CORY|nr:adenosylmethionine--8-amino-7-oxononanoate transaminase [Corynebacterium antarcticum]MCK7641328.1 adenosylmethionine--8-amino-7-oxononanoate transaminase [Corynebacterium antarcticum]MCK7660570.1 adenosylmethionine--8-amino-7-oxononanoate transaminase [Corynebacterium antarcticum]MCL0244559.1 adenosylmethionine--8-amino-7-oxononanoate transaminase [Corynebacterium antarcticum]MCX7490929.1 adenosylmethionine--8-amino-7-oxononanoate transaminase [Corynebacterium antarcticum]MCX7539884.1 adeno